jgi:hypothetical protein
MRQLPLLLVALSTSLAVWACSSAAPDTDSSAGAQTVGNDNSKSSKPAASASASAAPSASASAVDAGTGNACYDACVQKYPQGAQVSDQATAAFSSCMCEADACGSACGKSAICTDAGAEPAEGDACDQCLTGSGADTCGQKSDDICTGDCPTYEACLDQCDQAAGYAPSGSSSGSSGK